MYSGYLSESPGTPVRGLSTGTLALDIRSTHAGPTRRYWCVNSLPILVRLDMSGSGGAYGTKASDTDFRKKWDKEEYAEKAKQKDLEERERMQENEERMKQGILSILHPQNTST